MNGTQPASNAESTDDTAIAEAMARMTGDVSTKRDGAEADQELWRRLRDDGWCALYLPERVGGAATGMPAIGPALAAMARAGRVTPFLMSAIIAAPLVAEAEANAASGLLEQLIAGKAVCTLGLAGASEALRRRDAPSASRTGDSWRLCGALPITFDGGGAAQILVPAVCDTTGQELVFLASRNTLDGRSYMTWGDAPAADLQLDGELPSSSLVMQGEVATSSLNRATWRARIGASWEAMGQMEALLSMTQAHVDTRVQFGRPLGALQSVQHRLAEMWVWLTEIRALLAFASRCRHDQECDRLGALAKARTGEAARYVSRQAVQLHGAMGVTAESQISTFFRRLMMFEQAFGDIDAALRALSEVQLSGRAHEDSVVLPRDPGAVGGIVVSSLDADFRNEVRSFLDAELTDDLRLAQQQIVGLYPEHDAGKLWQRTLNKRGWGAPLWPREFGGCGWSATQRIIFEAEAARAYAPVVSPFGLRLAGPVIIRYGTDEQCRAYLPSIVAGDAVWCQGFSEPGAGSDLASLSTQTRRDGDGYIINGSKIWTTRAHNADMMFALLRTGGPGKPRDGLSMFLIPMTAAGLTVRPILSITEDHELNQVFFDDVRVDEGQRLGVEGQGWEIARYLLEFERGGGLFSARHRASLARVRNAIDGARPGLLGQDWAARRFAAAAASVDAFEILECSVLGKLEPGQSAGIMASVLKLRSSRLKQEIGELAVELLGAAGARRGSEFDVVTAVVADHLEARATTIFGGASEVQLDLIARSLVGATI